ncbi:hypothetical protein NL676_007842 [Syzygium grande]|nr:hypothetical protein NL676_007842 [Syzygium grande]
MAAAEHVQRARLGNLEVGEIASGGGLANLGRCRCGRAWGRAVVSETDATSAAWSEAAMVLWGSVVSGGGDGAVVLGGRFRRDGLSHGEQQRSEEARRKQKRKKQQ